MGDNELGCEDCNLVELAQDSVQWRTSVSAALILRIMLPVFVITFESSKIARSAGPLITVWEP
jgi:hypothetical protein